MQLLYTDIQLTIPAQNTGCVIEVKYAENGDFDSACEEAMRQIEDGGYTAVLKQEGIGTIHTYGIACYLEKVQGEVWFWIGDA